MKQNLHINGETVAVSQEMVLVTELFLNEHYRFRRNVLNGKVEFMTLPEGEDALASTHPRGTEQHLPQG